ncbi:tetratricopeptide repeat protein [Dokdonella sp. MW10]|uniref:tetratricopeptide repeat protein n=1 Tax=Dokdonella sp. MW10 TaxID=2992926 RepID=UPI003F7E9841
MDDTDPVGDPGGDKARWKRVGECFDAIVELEGAARDAALAAIADARVRDEVLRLLAGDAALENGARDPVADPLAFAMAGDRSPDAHAGVLVGPWRILRELGRGGMGVVYLAERADGQYEQYAALKLMRASGDAAALRRRFLRERQILARLEHPHIARLLDGGISTAGEPWFALEYIDGEPLTTFVARRPVDARVRLQLFLDVCAAVQFAHRQLVVHCDIKPTNVLVNADGMVKLLDFGIANVMAGDESGVAETQMHALTPAYASPEQLRGDPVTTASDVYGLGAVLHELLTGVRAHGLSAGASLTERLAAIGDARRALPSRAVEKTAACDASRDGGLAGLPARTLRGDLDVITSTALHADPDRRYASVDALADDVRRHLAGAPIAMRAPSVGYRVGKFVARHRAGVALAILAVAALFVALGAAIVQAGRAREQAEEARQAAVRALEQGERAEAVRRILVGVFEQAAPDAHDGQPITARQLLEQGERQIEGAIAAQPAVEAEAATLIAELYVQIGVLDRAEGLLQRALEATDDPRVPDDVKARVLVGIAAIFDEKAQPEDAIDHARRGLALLGDGGRGVAPTVAKAHYVVAHGLVVLGRHDEAEAMLRASILRDRSVLGPHSDAVADSLVQLGNVYGATDRFDESEAAFREAIAIFTQTYGEDSYHVAHVLNELSNMLQDKPDLAGAEAALRESLAIRLRTVGPDHRDTLIVRHNLLVLLETDGRLREALPQRLEAVERLRGSGRLHARDLASYHLALGRAQRDTGDFDAAAKHLRVAIEQFSGSLGEDSDPAITAWRALGHSLGLAGRVGEARDALLRAVALQRGRDPPDAGRIAAAEADLAHLERLEGRPREALARLEGAVAGLVAYGRERTSLQPSALVAFAEAKLALGDVDGAREDAAAALQAVRASTRPLHFHLGTPLLTLARAHLSRGDADTALPLLDEALQSRSTVQEPGDVRIVEIEVERVRALEALGRHDDAAVLRAVVSPRVAALPRVHAVILQERLDQPVPKPPSGS